MLVSYIFMALLYSLELMMCMFTTVTNNVRPNYLSVRPKLSLFGHVSMQNQIVIFSTEIPSPPNSFVFLHQFGFEENTTNA